MSAPQHTSAAPPPPPPTDSASPTIRPALRSERRRGELGLFLFVATAAVVVTTLVMWTGTTSYGLSAGLGALGVLVILALIAWRPLIAFYLVAIAIAVVEEGPLPIPDFTDHLPVFQWPASLAGQPERPIGYLLIYTFLVIMARRFVNRERLLQGGKLIGPFLVFMLCVAFGVLHGLASGGSTKIIVVEIRPFWYLFVSYLLATNLVTHLHHVRTFFWIGLFGAGVKSLQGMFIVYIVLRGLSGAPRAIMAHEDSFFWVAVLLLIILFRLHSTYRPQLYVALLELPGVIIALVANNRRADYVALLVGIVVAWALVYKIKPHARKRLVMGMLLSGVVLIGYTFAFQNSSGILGQPARAVMSVISSNSASAEDAASNRYRVMEDFDLRFTVRQSPIIGMGFGKPFYQPFELPNIRSLDPYYDSIPHNTVFWVWMRLGAVGFIAFWYLIGSIVVLGSITAQRLRTPYLQVVAIFVVSITVMEILVAYADYQLYFFRNVIYVGLLAGILVNLPAIDDHLTKRLQVDADPDLTAAQSNKRRAYA